MWVHVMICELPCDLNLYVINFFLHTHTHTHTRARREREREARVQLSLLVRIFKWARAPHLFPRNNKKSKCSYDSHWTVSHAFIFVLTLWPSVKVKGHQDDAHLLCSWEVTITQSLKKLGTIVFEKAQRLVFGQISTHVNYLPLNAK